MTTSTTQTIGDKLAEARRYGDTHRAALDAHTVHQGPTPAPAVSDPTTTEQGPRPPAAGRGQGTSDTAAQDADRRREQDARDPVAGLLRTLRGGAVHPSAVTA